MSDVKPPTLSETNTLLTTLTQRSKEVKVYRYKDLSSKDVQKAICENDGEWLGRAGNGSNSASQAATFRLLGF